MAGAARQRLGGLFTVWAGGLGIGTAAAFYSCNEQFYSNVAMPVLHRVFDPETSHRLAVKAVAAGIVPSPPPLPSDSDLAGRLKVRAFDRDFQHPIGLAAGFDKDAQAVDGLLKLGFSFVEVGSITPLPQDGNPRPRVFRLTEDSAIVNRYGFNSCGHEAALTNLLKSRYWRARSSAAEGGWVGVNLGVNKGSADPVSEYRAGAAKFAPVADYLAVNVSSPNTPGLRDLQGRRWLEAIVDAVVTEARKATSTATTGRSARKPMVLLKVSPDCSEAELQEICSVALARGADGLIVSNTTVSRPQQLRSSRAGEAGGLSGPPLAPLANRAISIAYAASQGRLTILGVGGLSSGADALEKLEAGASLLQVYTALTYEGPPLLTRVNRELAGLLKEKGYRSVGEAIGARHRKVNR